MEAHFLPDPRILAKITNITQNIRIRLRELWLNFKVSFTMGKLSKLQVERRRNKSVVTMLVAMFNQFCCYKDTTSSPVKSVQQIAFHDPLMEKPKTPLLEREHETGEAHLLNAPLTAKSSTSSENSRASTPTNLLEYLSDVAMKNPYKTFTRDELLLRGEVTDNTTYEKRDKCGQGGYTSVFKIEDTVTKKIYAGKELIPCGPLDRQKQPTVSLELYTEAVVHMSLDHPNIVQCFGYIASTHPILDVKFGKGVYLAMEYVPTTLYRLLKTDFNFGVELAHSFAIQLLDGLAYLHKRSIMHRDIKPDNLLLSAKGELKIADFNLCSSFKTKDNKWATYIVTSHYRAPELFFNVKDYNWTIDMWSAGCVLIQLYTRCHPYANRTDRQHELLKNMLAVCGNPNPQIQTIYTEWMNIAKLPIPSKTFTRIRERTLETDFERRWKRIHNTKPNPTILAMCSNLVDYDYTLRCSADDCAHIVRTQGAERGNRRQRRMIQVAEFPPQR
jgi:serine/threonine protein kinase